MSPFREPPEVTLGPLDVGLGRAARRAMIGMIPSGGRLVAPQRRAPHAFPGWGDSAFTGALVGALGSLGLLLVIAVAFVARAAGMTPGSAFGTLFFVALVLAGGYSLAVVLRAIDEPRARLALPGEVVGRAARRALRRVMRLSGHAARSPERVSPRRVAALRRTLDMLTDPLVADWIPADVRGRTELLLARAMAASGGARWARDARLLIEVRSLLAAAAAHLSEPGPARSDLLTLDEIGGPGERRDTLRR